MQSLKNNIVLFKNQIDEETKKNIDHLKLVPKKVALTLINEKAINCETCLFTCCYPSNI